MAVKGKGAWSAIVVAAIAFFVVGAAEPSSPWDDRIPVDPEPRVDRADRKDVVRGVVSVVGGDPRPGLLSLPREIFFLHTDSGSDVMIHIDDEILARFGGAWSLHDRRVEAVLESTIGASTKAASSTGAFVRSLRVLDRAVAPTAAKAISGSQPWISILCKFSDVSAEPKDLAYFQNMYSSTYPGLDYYWRELSYDKANVSGSTAVAWVDLPHPVSHYESPGGGDLNAMLSDCTAAADPYVYFPDFVGINMMFNDAFGPYAWGGGRYVNLDGQSKYYRVTWDPPWGFSNAAVIAHEMGHGFGLPHSNNADADGNPYDNPWDVMSDSWHYYVYDPTYKVLGKGTIAFHRDILGWIDPARKLEIDSPGITTVTLDHLTLEPTSNLRMVKINIPGTSRFYTAEVRDLESFDAGLPDFAVVIHEVDTSRSEDAWLVDIEAPTNGADEGAMWRIGECFEDLPNEISVCVLAATTEGFSVRISYGSTDVVFSDGFEAGGMDNWTVPSE